MNKIKNNYKRLFSALVLVFFMTIPAYSQFEGQFTQYMHTKSYINPGAVGEQQMMEVLVAQRLQWLGIKNAPKTTLFSANTPFKIGKSTHAGGIQFLGDFYGLFSNQQITLQYAYKHKFENVTLSAGINLGVLNIIINGDSARMVESDYHSSNDPKVPINKQSGVGFDMGVGLYLSNPHFFAGISILHLPGAKIHLGDNYQFVVKQHYSVMGGYNIRLYNPNFTLKPSALIVTDMASWQAYISCMLDYKDKFWGGLTYSIQNAVSFSFGMEIINGLRFGYTYDLPASRIIRATSGSHELFIAYDFNLFVPKKEHKHKSIRIL